MSVQGYWADLKAPEFKDLPPDLVAVLPLGAIEQHGPHLPVSVDRDLIDAVAAQALQRCLPEQNVLILPTLTITKSGEHDRHPGTLSLSADTLLATLRDIGASVARAGVTRLVLFNGHGGNTALLEVVARDLRIAHDMIVAVCSWFGFATYDGPSDDQTLSYDLHAGETETAAMLAVRPDRVDMDLAQDFRPAVQDWEAAFSYIGLTGQAARPAWIIDDMNPHGVCGNALAADPVVGAQLIGSAGRDFAKFLQEFARFDPRGDQS